MTLAFPLLVMKGTVTDNTEICIADLTGGVSGGGRGRVERADADNSVVTHADLAICCKQFFFFYVIAGHRL